MMNQPLEERERAIKDGKPFLYSPLVGAGPNEGEEYYQQ